MAAVAILAALAGLVLLVTGFHIAGTWLFATPSGRMVEVAIDARVGGSFRLVDCRDGEPVAHLGEYVAIERPSRLVFDFGVPTYSPERNRVVIEFASCPAGCDVTLTQQLGPDMGEWADRVEQGWRGILDGLAVELARSAVTTTAPVGRFASPPRSAR